MGSIALNISFLTYGMATIAYAILLGLIFNWLKPDCRETGIVHVISRMHSHYGQLPLRNALLTQCVEQPPNVVIATVQVG